MQSCSVHSVCWQEWSVTLNTGAKIPAFGLGWVFFLHYIIMLICDPDWRERWYRIDFLWAHIPLIAHINHIFLWLWHQTCLLSKYFSEWLSSFLYSLCHYLEGIKDVLCYKFRRLTIGQNCRAVFTNKGVHRGIFSNKKARSDIRSGGLLSRPQSLQEKVYYVATRVCTQNFKDSIKGMPDAFITSLATFWFLFQLHSCFHCWDMVIWKKFNHYYC